MIKAVLFDYDNTLGNREAYAYELYREIVETHHADLDSFDKECITQSCMILDQHGFVNKNYVKDSIRTLYGIELYPGDLNAFWEKNLGRYAECFEDAKELLEKLKPKYTLAVITNGDSYGQRSKLERSGILPYFEEVFISGAVGITKPDPRIFLMAAEKLGVRPEECVFVGDGFRTDIRGAKKAGMNPVWMWPFSERKMREDIPVIHRISELETVLSTITDR